jgi:uncharacterized membrane protein
MITLEHIYVLIGLFLLVAALQTLSDRGNARRFSSAVFWSLLAIAFLAGDYLPADVMGALVVALAIIAGAGGLRGGSHPAPDPVACRDGAARLGHWLLLPVLMISVLTLVLAVGLKHVEIGGKMLISTTQTTVVSLGASCTLAFCLALRITGERPLRAVHAGRRLLDAVGWAALLPLLLAVLGGIFARAGVGELVSRLLTDALPLGNHAVALLAYALGMALFTMVMGNAFAAFPVISIGIGLPVLVGQHHADPAPLAALGMLAGYCGTLLTPMAANFNIVPAALLELRDQHAVIRAQSSTAVLLFCCNLALLFFLV